MVSQTNFAEEANEMLTKTRTTLIALVASVSFAGATVAPAVSQARSVTPVPTTVKTLAVSIALEGQSTNRPNSADNFECELKAQKFNKEIDEASQAAGKGSFQISGLMMEFAVSTLREFKSDGCVAK
jgi:hypothetical protein